MAHVDTATLVGRLKAERKARGLTQHQLAEASGISQPIIARMESGARLPPERAIKAIAEALGLEVERIDRWTVRRQK